MTRKRLGLAWASYGVFAVVAGLELEGGMRIAVWIFLAGLAVKSWLALLRQGGDGS